MRRSWVTGHHPLARADEDSQVGPALPPCTIVFLAGTRNVVGPGLVVTGSGTSPYCVGGGFIWVPPPSKTTFESKSASSGESFSNR